MGTKNRLQEFVQQLPVLASENDFNQVYRKIVRRQFGQQNKNINYYKMETKQQRQMQQKQQLREKQKDNAQQLKKQQSELNMNVTRKKFNITEEQLSEALFDLENYSTENMLNIDIKHKFTSLEDLQNTIYQLKKEISNQRLQFTIKKCYHYLTYSKVVPYLQLHNFNVINTISANEIEIEEQNFEYFKKMYEDIENLIEMNKTFKMSVKSNIMSQHKLQQIIFQCNNEIDKLKDKIEDAKRQIDDYNSSASLFQKVYQDNNQKIINLNMQMHKYLNVLALLVSRDPKFQLDIGTNKLLQQYFKEVTFSKLSSMNMGVSVQIYNNMKKQASLNVLKILNMITQIYTNDDVCSQIQSLGICKQDENQSEKNQKTYKLRRSEFNFMNNHSSVRFEQANKKMSVFDEIQQLKLNQSYYTFRKQNVIKNPEDDKKFKLSYNIKRQIFLQQEIDQMFMVQMHCRQEYYKEEVLIKSNQSNEQKFFVPSLRFNRSVRIQKVKKIIQNKQQENECKFIAPYERLI